MVRFAYLFLCAGAALAQTPSAPASPAPASVEQALRARINEFYQDQVDKKYRQAEALVADDTKDFYYAASKGRYLSFGIESIDYSNDFTRAKVVVQAEMYIMQPGFAGRPIKWPVRSTWKVVDGQWYWYVDQDALATTPFGKRQPTAGNPPTPQSGSSQSITIPTAEQMQFIFALMKADKQAVTLKPGESAQVTLTNTAPGLMNLSLQNPLPGVDAKLDTLELKAGAKAVLNIEAHEGAQPGKLTLQVEQTNQVIPIQVNIQ